MYVIYPNWTAQLSTADLSVLRTGQITWHTACVDCLLERLSAVLTQWEETTVVCVQGGCQSVGCSPSWQCADRGLCTLPLPSNTGAVRTTYRWPRKGQHSEYSFYCCVSLSRHNKIEKWWVNRCETWRAVQWSGARAPAARAQAWSLAGELRSLMRHRTATKKVNHRKSGPICVVISWSEYILREG